MQWTLSQYCKKANAKNVFCIQMAQEWKLKNRQSAQSAYDVIRERKQARIGGR
jgi:hypothetical protein